MKQIQSDDRDFFRVVADPAYRDEWDARRAQELPIGYPFNGFTDREMVEFQRMDGEFRIMGVVANLDLGDDRSVKLELAAINGEPIARFSDARGHTAIIAVSQLWRYHHPWYQPSPEERTLIRDVLAIDQLAEFGSEFADVEEIASVAFGEIRPT